ncbi:MAG: hypothetical protein NVSMB65_07490 [Chloroflexota bacterium]
MPSPVSLSTGAERADALRDAGTLMLLVRTLEQAVKECTGADALSLTDLAVLGRIDRGATLPSLLARGLRLDPARVTHISDRLVAEGYIVRTADSSDRRRWRLALTGRGQDRLEGGRALLREEMGTLLAQLRDDDREALHQGLTAIRGVLDAGDAAPDEVQRSAGT